MQTERKPARDFAVPRLDALRSTPDVGGIPQPCELTRHTIVRPELTHNAMKTSLLMMVLHTLTLVAMLGTSGALAASTSIYHERLRYLTGIDSVLIAPYSQWFMEGRDEKFYATFHHGYGYASAIYRMNRDGSDLTLVRFDPTNRFEGIIMGMDGLLYGTLASAPERGTPGIFRMAPDGSGFTMLKTFPPQTAPRTGVIQDAEGWLYGTIFVGGDHGKGTVFKLSTNGLAFEWLHHFGSVTNDGQAPGRLMVGSDGALYGCTFYGGSVSNHGTVFRLARDGSSYSVLHRFDGSPQQGRYPLSDRPLLEASDGFLYHCADGGFNRAGVIFRVGKQGEDFRVIHQFQGDNGTGDSPIGGLVEWCDGSLYGTTIEGGIDGAGIVYRVNKNGSGFVALKVYIDSPNPGATDGSPRTPLIRGADHRLYGLTAGGSAALGTLFRIDAWPSLDIRHTGESIVVSWQECAGTYNLQSSLDVCNHASWLPVAAPAQTVETQRQVTLPRTADLRFFRLARP